MAKWNHPVPGSSVSQQYGVENDGYKAGYHTGVDYSVATGTPVGSAAKGTVVETGSGGAYGNYIIIRHPNGMFTLYAHLKRVGVSKGDRVNEAEQIGLSGNTGNSSGPHLHFEVRDSPDYGSDENPLKFFGGKQVDVSKSGSGGGGNPYGNDNSVMHVLYQAGFRGAALATAYAIVQAESGGDNRAHNGDSSTGDNSYGLFQINMLGQMGADRRDQWNLESNRDLFDPLTNAKIAYRMSGGGKDWSAWTTYTRGTYKQHMDEGRKKAAKAQGSGGGGGGGGGSNPKRADFGFDPQFLEDNPEIERLVNQAVKQEWSVTRFQAKLKETRWWQNHTAAQRDWEMTEAEDPASAAETIKDYTRDIRSLALSLGVDLGDKEIKQLAEKAARNSWDATELQMVVGGKFRLGDAEGRGQTGQAASATYDLEGMADDFAVPMSRKQKARWTTNILQGEMTVDGYADVLREKAKALYPHLADAIDRAGSVRSWADAYLQQAANMLGQDPDTMRLDRGKYATLLAPTENGKPINMDQWERMLREDEKYGWDKTNGAQEEAAGLTTQLAQMMGAL